MKRTNLLSLALCCTMLLTTGCAASLPASLGGGCYNKTLPSLLDATDLKVLFTGMAAELCVDRCVDCSNGPPQDPLLAANNGGRGTVLVTDFADLQSLTPNQSGLLMGELMRGSLNEACCSRVVQAEFSRYFKLSESGLVILTRKAAEIKHNEYSQPEVVVGTYNYLNNDKVVIFARKINTETGIISRMVTREVNYSCAGRTITGYTVK